MDVNGMKSSTQKSIEIFMQASGQTVCDRPTILSDTDRVMRATLTFEEAMEKIESLGVQVLDSQGRTLTSDSSCVRFNLLPAEFFDLVNLIRECIDLRVIATGTLISIGVPDMPPQLEIDQSNLRKIGPDGKCRRRVDGKLLKPDGWQPPDIRKVLLDIFPDYTDEGLA